MRKIFLILGLLAFAMAAAAQSLTYDRKVFTASDGTDLNYRMLSPDENAKGKKFPLVIFLHGLGERGDDNEKQLLHGGQMFLNPVVREKYPSYVVFPQCPETAFWAYNQVPSSFGLLKKEDKMPAPFNAVKELIDVFLAYPDIDPSRIYIMGISMGGMATFDMVDRFPEIFAAAVPICGFVETERLKDIEGVNFRIYHGDADPVVPVEFSREAYKVLKKAGANVEYREFPGCQHDSWNPAFNTTDFLEWLFKQKKSRKYLR